MRKWVKPKVIHTGLGDELTVSLGHEKSRIWLLRRIPDEVTILLPNGLFSELKKKKYNALQV